MSALPPAGVSSNAVKWLHVSGFPGRGFTIGMVSGETYSCECHEGSSQGSTLWYHSMLRFLVERVQQAKAKYPETDDIPVEDLYVTESVLRGSCKLPGRALDKSKTFAYMKKCIKHSVSEGDKVFSLLSIDRTDESKYRRLRHEVGKAMSDAIQILEEPGCENVFFLAFAKSDAQIFMSGADTAKRYQPAPYSLADHYRAHREYFEQGDSPEMVRCREVLMRRAEGLTPREGDPTCVDAVSIICNYLEQWARAVHLGFLPLEEFNSSSGDMAANMLMLCEEEIRAHRKARNSRYSMWHARFIEQLLVAGFLDHWTIEQRARLRRIVEEFSFPYSA